MSYNLHRLHRFMHGKVIDKKLKKSTLSLMGSPCGFEKKRSNLKNLLQVQEIIRTEEFICFISIFIHLPLEAYKRLSFYRFTCFSDYHLDNVGEFFSNALEDHFKIQLEQFEVSSFNFSFHFQIESSLSWLPKQGEQRKALKKS